MSQEILYMWQTDMKIRLPLMTSRYLRIKDGIWRMFVRWAYHKYLDELYIPEKSVVQIFGKRVLIKSSAHPHKWVDGYCETDGYYPKRLGVQEVSLTEKEPML